MFKKKRHASKQGGGAEAGGGGGGGGGGGIDFNINRKDDKVIAPLRAENLAMNVKSRVDPMVARSNALGHVVSAIPPPKPNIEVETTSRDNSKMEPSFGDHLSEMNKLRDEISMLKKVISQKVSLFSTLLVCLRDIFLKAKSCWSF